MAKNEVRIEVTGDAKDAERSLKSVTKTTERLTKAARVAGIALTGMGVAVAGMAALTVKAALEQRRATQTLQAVVEASGASWDEYRGKIEGVTAALQDKTNFGDEQQLRALARMMPALGSVDRALDALPAVLDAASASGLGLDSVAGTLSRALAGLVDTSDSTGLTFEKTADFGERLEQVFGVVAGAAEANVDPFTQFGNEVKKLREAIGDALLPTLIPLMEKLKDVLRQIVDWTKENPKLTRVIVLLTAALGAFALVVGPLLIALPLLAGGVGIVTGAFSALMALKWGAFLISLRSFAATSGIIAAQLAAVAGLLWLASAGFRAAWESFKRNELVGFWTIMAEDIEKAKGVLRSVADAFNSAIAPALADTKAKADEAAKAFDPGLTGALKGVSKGVQALKDILGQLAERDRILRQFQMSVAEITKAFEDLTEAGNEVADWLSAKMVQAFLATRKAAREAVEATRQRLLNEWDMLQQMAQDQVRLEEDKQDKLTKTLEAANEKKLSLQRRFQDAMASLARSPVVSAERLARIGGLGPPPLPAGFAPGFGPVNRINYTDLAQQPGFTGPPPAITVVVNLDGEDMMTGLGHSAARNPE